MPLECSDQTSLFLHLAKDFMSPLPPIVPLDTTCLAVVQRMRQEAAPRVLVSDPDGRLVGILSSGDILNRVTFTVEALAPIQPLLSQPVHTVREDLPLYRAVALMRDHRLRHLPVVDADNRPRGMLLVENILAPLLGKQLALVEAIADDHTPATLCRAKQTQAELAAVFLEQRLLPSEITAVLSRLNDEIYRRILEQSIRELDEGGWGKPPVAFAAVVTGSGGRWESLLRPDQDNGFILEDYPDERYPEVNEYFYELAARLTRALDATAIPLCSGQVMASNHAWRKRFSEWQRQWLGWLRKPSIASTTLLDIWIDFRCVFGDQRLVEELRAFATEAIPRHHGFLRELEAQQFDHDVAITPLGTLKRERLPGQYGHRKVDIKRKGLRPLLEGIRILALREGVPATETLVRLKALRGRNILKPDLADAVEEAFQGLLGLLLRAQLRDLREGRPPGAYVAAEDLSQRERLHLKDALRSVARLRNMVHAEFTAELF